MTAERLQKLMASSGVGSRRYCESLITGGQVKVNGLVASLGDRADLDNDDVEVVGWGKVAKVVSDRIYIVLNKPRGFV